MCAPAPNHKDRAGHNREMLPLSVPGLETVPLMLVMVLVPVGF
jgi:hypothetical protein